MNKKNISGRLDETMGLTSSRMLEQLMANSTDNIYFKDRDCRIIMINEGRKVFDGSVSELGQQGDGLENAFRIQMKVSLGFTQSGMQVGDAACQPVKRPVRFRKADAVQFENLDRMGRVDKKQGEQDACYPTYPISHNSF